MHAKIRYFERIKDCQKVFKKPILVFLLKPVPFNRLDFEKQKGLELVNSCFFQATKQFQNNYCISDILPDHVWRCLQLFVIPKITFANWCNPVHNIINYSTFIFPFESRKCRKKEKKFEYLDNKKSFLGQIKSIFHDF